MKNYLADGSMSFVLRFIVLVIALIFKGVGASSLRGTPRLEKKEINQFIE